jgi:predicted esterase
MAHRALLLGLVLGALPSHGEPKTWLCSAPARDRGAAVASPLGNTRQPARQSIRIEALDAAATPPTYVSRGEPLGPRRIVFLHGMCGHALGYAQSFQWSAAKHGMLVAPQGDVPCSPGSPWAKWSMDSAALDARILSAFRALGSAEPIADIAVIGYSQGASRAEALARRWPERYTRLILIAGPAKVSPDGLAVHSALMMAGTLDRQDLMQASARAFKAAGRRAHYMPLPNAQHGAMGSTPEQSMSAALAWLYEPTPSTNTD